MKITFVLPFAGLSGGIKVAAIYAEKLTERGHDVTVVSQPAPNISVFRKLKSILRGNGWPSNFQATPYLDFLKDRHIILKDRRPVLDADLPDADVIIATWWETAEWVAKLGVAKGRKFYLIQGYEVLPNLPKRRVIDTYSLPLKKLAVSGFIYNTLQERHSARDVDVVLNSVDLEQFLGPERSKSSRFTLGFLYQNLPSKNTSLAIKALQEAKEKFPEIRVVVFGKVRPQAPDLLPDWVEYHFSPEQDLIPKLYAACDAWLFTSHEEGFGLPILEAMASRTPVIATRAGAAPDLIDGTNGVLTDATPEAFTSAIQKFAEMKDAEWQKWSHSAYKTAASYTWDDATDLLERHLSA